MWLSWVATSLNIYRLCSQNSPAAVALYISSDGLSLFINCKSAEGADKYVLMGMRMWEGVATARWLNIHLYTVKDISSSSGGLNMLREFSLNTSIPFHQVLP